MEPSATDDLRNLAKYLVGPAEIGALLAVDSNTINVWKTRHQDFPKPVRRLKAGEVWDVREIESWARATKRLPLDDSGI